MDDRDRELENRKETLTSMRNDLRAARQHAAAELQLASALDTLSEMDSANIERDEHVVQHKLWQNIVSSLEYSIEHYMRKISKRNWLVAYNEQMLTHQQNRSDTSSRRQSVKQLLMALSALRNIGAFTTTQEEVVDALVHLSKTKGREGKGITQAQIASYLHMPATSVRDCIKQIAKKVEDLQSLYEAFAGFTVREADRWYLAAALSCLQPKQRFCLVESLRGRTFEEIVIEAKRMKKWKLSEKEVQKEIVRGVRTLQEAFEEAQTKKESVKEYLAIKNR